MSNEKFIAWVQAILSAFYLVLTFIVILIYEMGWAHLVTPGQEKTFDGMVNWMTGGALIVLYFWLQRAKASSIPDSPVTTPAATTPTDSPQTPPVTG